MPDSTPLGFPFPLPTDQVAAGAADIRALAEAVDAKITSLEAFVLQVAGGWEITPGNVQLPTPPAIYESPLSWGKIPMATGPAAGYALELRFTSWKVQNENSKGFYVLLKASGGWRSPMEGPLATSQAGNPVASAWYRAPLGQDQAGVGWAATRDGGGSFETTVSDGVVEYRWVRAG